MTRLAEMYEEWMVEDPANADLWRERMEAANRGELAPAKVPGTDYLSLVPEIVKVLVASGIATFLLAATL